jgi:hypothetical protein
MELVLLADENGGDREALHEQADDILVAVLSELGYDELCSLYRAIGKWYA